MVLPASETVGAVVQETVCLGHASSSSSSPRRPASVVLVSLAIAVNLLWALSYPISKLVLLRLAPLTLTTWRLALGGVLLLALVRRGGVPRHPTRRDLAWLVLMGAIGCGLATLLQYVGTTKTLAANVAMLVGLEPVAVVLLAALLLGEALTARGWLSLPLATLGVVLITVDPSSLDLLSSQFAVGNALALAAVGCFAIYTVAAKRLAARWSTAALTALPLLIAAGLLALVGSDAHPALRLFPLQQLDRFEWLGFGFIVVVATAGCFVIWNWLLVWMPANRLSYSLFVQPLAGAALCRWLLGEPLSPSYFAGAVVIAAAVSLGLARSPRRAPAQPRPPAVLPASP